MILPKIKWQRRKPDRWFCRAATAALLLLGTLLQAEADPRIDRNTGPARNAAPPPPVRPTPGAAVIEEHGIASWYGRHWQGRRTASGSRFDDRRLTAAHLWLPFATRAHVTNLENGRSVDVVVNDRGPYHKGRIIDLSAGAAAKLGMRRAGLAPVAITAKVATAALLRDGIEGF
jgi:rare lipoprotein A